MSQKYSPYFNGFLKKCRLSSYLIELTCNLFVFWAVFIKVTLPRYEVNWYKNVRRRPEGGWPRSAQNYYNNTVNIHAFERKLFSGKLLHPL